MNRLPLTPQLPANHRQRENRLIATLRRHSIAVTSGWLVDRRGNLYPHGRVVEKVRTA